MYLEILEITVVGLILLGLTHTTEKLLNIRQGERDHGQDTKTDL